MTEIPKIVHHEGIVIQNRVFFSTEFPRLSGKEITVEIPDGQLPSMLMAKHESDRFTLLEYAPPPRKTVSDRYLREDLIKTLHLLLYTDIFADVYNFVSAYLSQREQAHLMKIMLAKQRQVRALLQSKPGACSFPIEPLSTSALFQALSPDCFQSHQPVDSEIEKDC